MGLGSGGHSRQFASYPFRERSMVFVDERSTHGYRDEEGRTFAISISGGPGLLGRDTISAVERDSHDSHSLGHRNQLRKRDGGEKKTPK